MASKKKEPEKHCYAVPYQVTMTGTVLIDAETAEEAVALAKQGSWDDDTFFTRASMTDWEVKGYAVLSD